MKKLLCFALLLPTVIHPQAWGSDNPQAAPGAVVVEGRARFTLLTPQLIRLEWSEDGTFEDRASLVFINRQMPVPKFSRLKAGDSLVLQTEKLRLVYRPDAGRFTDANLHIRLTVSGREVDWRPGMEDSGNLGGTIRTLDGVDAPVPLEPGLLSRNGWTVVDDSERPLFDNSDWPWVLSRPGQERQDLYFFGYGHDYRKALFDFTQVAGKIPMPPRFAFGLWWSRYWAYTDRELKDLVREFETHEVPLDVLVIDMDWHNTFDLRWDTDKRDQAGQRLGWTGYTWNRDYFPDPPAFLQWCEEKGLKTPLNIHPASGIQPHEEVYPEMARAMGIDPATRKYVPFDIVDKKFAENYLNIVLHPLEKEGVDFWWLDWQQWGTTKIPGVTPTWWLNYVFFTDMERQGKARPLLFHRWGGLGNHRYEIGFSGDAHSNWDVLKFESYFTATASNVGFGYWSHDIGGHIPGPVSPELYTRWIQFGAFSPILRTHTTKNALAERRIWGYPDEYYEIMRNAILLRYALIPYIYTASREAYDTGVSICRPLYYDYPEQAEAYDFKDEYMFGDDMLVAPIAQPIDSGSLLARRTLWLPQGEWYEWFTGTRLKGPAVVTRSFALDEIPVYVKAGAVIPMQPDMRNSHEKPIDPLLFTVFPGDSGTCRVYEDDGNSIAYQHETGKVTMATVSMAQDRSETVFRITPARDSSGPGAGNALRSYEVRFPGTWPPGDVSVNGKPLSLSQEHTAASWWYEGQPLTTVVSTGQLPTGSEVTVRLRTSPLHASQSGLLNGVPGAIARLRRVMPLINTAWPKDWAPDVLVRAAQTGNRIALHPDTGYRELTQFPALMQEVLNSVDSLHCDRSIMRRVRAHLDIR